MSRLAPVALVILALAPAAVSAEPSPEDAVKYRETLFHTLGAQMKDLNLITKGKAGRPEDMLGHAIVMHETAKIVGHAFPAGTGPDKVEHTRAKAEIWSDAAGFEAAWKRLVDASGKLVKVAKKKDVEGVAAALGEVGASCGGCHEAYRGPEHEDHHE